MSSQPTSPQAAKFSRPTVKVKRRPRQHIDHAEIVRMAEAEAASRAAERHDRVATAAYFLAQQRGFEPGHELEDWLTAETDVVRALQLDIQATGADAP